MSDKKSSGDNDSNSSNAAGPPVNEKLLKLMAQLMAQNQAQSQLAQQDPRSVHKSLDEYKFWSTQPVEKFEKEPVEQGPIEVKTVADVPKDPQPLPKGFEWSTIDVTDDKQLNELYELLYGNYIEDDDEQFRFKYSVPFLRWAHTPPGWNPQFTIGVRASESGKLLASIMGIPATLSVRQKEISAVEINFLCVHKQLRSKRLAPVLIKEVTRRVNLTGVWQALFTAATVIPTPISTAQYYHRVINWTKLYDVGFAHLPSGSTPAQQVARAALPSKVDLPGFRTMKAADVDDAHRLLSSYLNKFDLHQVFSRDEFAHWFLAENGNTPVRSYVVETDGVVTDFISFYGLESTVLGEHKHNAISVAYTFYYATTALGPAVKSRLEQLFQAMLVEVSIYGYDVLNALTVMDNPLVFDALKFSPGDGFLNYNLFNWKTPPVWGGINGARDKPKGPGGVGVVLL